MSIFEKSPPKIGEIHDILCKHKNVEIAHIISSSKLPDFEYDQSEDEFAIVLEGAAVLRVENREIKLKKGEYIFIKAHAKHSVISCEDGTRWLAVYVKG